MFHSPWFRSGTIISDEGFQLTLTGRYQLEYREKPGLTAYFTYDAVFPNFDLLTLSISAYQGDHLVSLEDSQQSKIFDNIAAALEWKGWDVHFVRSA